MGGGGSKEIEGQVDYERLGPVVVKQLKDGGLQQDKISIMEFQRAIESETIYKQWIKDIEKIKDTEIEEVLLLPMQNSFKKAGMCGSSGFVNLTYQNFPFVLDSEIINRKRLGRFFLETQVWYLLYNIIRAGNKFEIVKKKIGDIQPNNILINDDGQIKILSTVSLPNQLNNFEKFVENPKSKVYLAPEELSVEAQNRGEYPSAIDPCRAEVFSIGLTILSSGTLEDCGSVYEGNKINETKLNYYLGKFRQKYSNYLFTNLVNMLSMRPLDRKRSSDIYKELSPFQASIMDLEEFVPETHQYQQPQQQRPVSVYSGQPTQHAYYDQSRFSQPMQNPNVYARR